MKRSTLWSRLGTLSLAGGLLAMMPVAPLPRVVAQDSAQSATEVDRLIADLGADDFKKRDEAQKKLEALGPKAIPALERAEKESKDAEVRARAHEAIAAIKRGAPDAPPGAPARRPRDREREGNPRDLAPPTPLPIPDEDNPDLDELFKMFGRENPMRDLPKIFERLQKQFEQFDEEDQQGNGNPRGGIRIIPFGARPRSGVERKLGLALNPPAPALRAQLDLSPTDGGLVVDELAPNSPAWKAGLKRYDVIVSIDGKPVRSPADLAGLGKAEAKVEVIRKAKRETVLVHAGEAAPETPKTERSETKPEKAEPKKDEPVRKF